MLAPAVLYAWIAEGGDGAFEQLIRRPKVAIMRRNIILLVCSMGFALTQVPSPVSAQMPGPGWWTNTSSLTNLPAVRGKKKTQGVIPHGKNAASDLPKDVQSLIQQFQQESKQLMNSLQGANDAQRQQVLQQLSQLRDQLQGQLRDMTQQARDQALDMRSRFGGNFGPGNAPGAGGPPTSGHGKPRP